MAQLTPAEALQTPSARAARAGVGRGGCPLSAVLVLVGLTVACGSEDGQEKKTDASEVVRRYAVNMKANYADTVAKLEALQGAVDSFVAEPSQSGLEAAQAAWLDAHAIYGQSEVSRFYGGPLDDAQGRVNEWPLDENFLDYTADEPAGGIVNSPDAYPEITVELLKSTDHQGGLENLPAGFHAIEFLLWGQRLSQSDGPGNRPYTDYVDDGTGQNQDRRRAYLKAATDLLLSDLQGVVGDWDLSDPNSYGSEFVAAPVQDSIQSIARGLTDLSISELYYERLLDPYTTMDRKDEESCFSESTYTDLVANATGVENVYLGRYGTLSGPGLSDLVRERDPKLDDQLKQQLRAVVVAIEAIPQPFDHAVIAPATSEEHQKVQAALQTFWPLLPHNNPGSGPQNLYESMAATLGVVINL